MIISIQIILIMIGFVLIYLTEILPLFRIMQMEWIGAILVALPTFLMVIRMSTSKSLKMYEKKPVGKELIIFIRRDGTCEPLYGKRPFHGESFLEIPQVGLIHDLGKGTVYRWGDKNVRFALENVNHTPSPKFVNFTSWLYDLGFDNMPQVAKGLSGQGDDEKRIIEDLPELPVVRVEDDIDSLLKKMEVKKHE